MALSLPTAYVTLAEADLVNANVANNSQWLAASDTAKTSALSYSRLYIDDRYTSIKSFDLSDVPDVVQIANSILAVKYLSDTLYVTPEAHVKSSTVKAGEVMSKTVYARSEDATAIIDSNPEVTALLKGYFRLKQRDISVNLVRG